MDCRDTIVLGFARKEGGIVRSWHRRYFVIKTRQPDKDLGRYPLGKHGWQGPGATKPNPNATVTGNPPPTRTHTTTTTTTTTNHRSPAAPILSKLNWFRGSGGDNARAIRQFPSPARHAYR